MAMLVNMIGQLIRGKRGYATWSYIQLCVGTFITVLHWHYYHHYLGRTTKRHCVLERESRFCEGQQLLKRLRRWDQFGPRKNKENTAEKFNQTTEKREVLSSFQMSPRTWQKENRVQGRRKEEIELIGGWHTGYIYIYTAFLSVGEEFCSHWKESIVFWAR